MIDTQSTKSERTRARIREAASTLFSERGFEGVSIRDVAERAGCDPALVMRYFGSKDGLFAETSDFELRLPDLGGLSSDQAARCLAAHFVTIWEDPEIGARFRVLLRSAASHPPSAKKLRKVFVGQVVPALVHERGDRELSAQTPGLVSSVLLGFAMTRYVLKLPPIVEMPRENLIEHLTRFLSAILSNHSETSSD